ncbi:hypothetical protein ES703_50018 [subsurface metagenome]
MSGFDLLAYGMDLSVRILLLLMGFFFCRGLIYQAHLFEYTNKLNGFNFSYSQY